ncbi:SAP domain [Popillia japonica]|uniref:SAP domain n=1 Tax=Popillia japonica TaxID=7064 RepID=A0AAW1ISL3_POPJA
MKNNSSQLKIKTLRVKELQQELQKRGLAQTGKKAVLLKRLQNALNSSELNDNNIANSSPDKTIQTNTIVKKAIITYKPKSKYYMKTIQSLRHTIVTLKKEIRSIKFSLDQVCQTNIKRLDQVCQTNIKQKTDKGAGKKSVKSKVANLLSGSSSIHNNSSMSNPNLKDNDSFNFSSIHNNSSMSNPNLKDNDSFNFQKTQNYIVHTQ